MGPQVKELLNLSEARTHERVTAAVRPWGAAVYPKVRLADVFPITGSGISDELYRYALQAHFDILVVEDRQPVFAVEFDGPTHETDAEQCARDRKKYEVALRFDFPFVRVTGQHLDRRHRGIDVVTWLCETYYVTRELLAAQSRGEMDQFEPIDPVFVARSAVRPGAFPYVLSGAARQSFLRRYQDGQLATHIPTRRVGVGSHGRWSCLAAIRLTSATWVSAHVELTTHWRAWDVRSLLEELAIIELDDAVTSHLENGLDARTAIDVEGDFRQHRAEYELRGGGGGEATEWISGETTLRSRATRQG